MRVLHIIDIMSVGGAQFLIKGIFETYPNTDQHLFVLRKSGDLIEVNHPNITYSKSTAKYSVKSLIEIKNYINKHQIEIIHCYLLKSQIFGWILKSLWFINIKLIFHELGEIFINNSSLFVRFMQISQKKTNLYFAVSDATEAALHEKIGIPKNKIITLYNYVIAKDYKLSNVDIDIEQKKRAYNIMNDEFVLGYAGRLSPEKGPIHLINALPHINHKFKLLIAGTGNQQQMLKAQLENLGLQDKVIFLGFVKEMKNIYALFDTLIIPSEHESFGLVAVEAQLMETPVIASDVPGLNEVVIENVSGLQFETKNPKDLAEKINTLIESKALQQELITKGKVFAEKYDINSYYTKMTNAYKELTSA